MENKIEQYHKSISEIISIIPEYLSASLVEVDTDNLIEYITLTAYRPYFNDGDRCDYNLYS
jgi:hypothetical protein